VEELLKQIMQGITELRGEITELRQEVQEIRQEVQETNRRLDVIEKGFDRVNIELDFLSGKLGKAEKDIHSINQRIQS
jgi:chromosome segregation ATPase